MTPWLLLAIALLLVVMCGVFVAAEFAFVTVDKLQVERAAAGGDASAQGVMTGLRSLSTQLSGAQVGITVTNLGIGFLAEPAIADLLEEPLGAVGVPDAAVSPVAIALGLT
ncbi:MAG: CNNM domain-containing protein, partial [Nocardioides sp.]